MRFFARLLTLHVRCGGQPFGHGSPISSPVTSHIIVTFALALVVHCGGHRLRILQARPEFLGLFAPRAPKALLPLVVFIEIISFLSRPISLSVRLFANMLAGTSRSRCLRGFIVSLGSLGAIWRCRRHPAASADRRADRPGIPPLISFIQAYVFAILTCMYLNDAVHPNH